MDRLVYGPGKNRLDFATDVDPDQDLNPGSIFPRLQR